MPSLSTIDISPLSTISAPILLSFIDFKCKNQFNSPPGQARLSCAFVGAMAKISSTCRQPSSFLCATGSSLRIKLPVSRPNSSTSFLGKIGPETDTECMHLKF